MPACVCTASKQKSQDWNPSQAQPCFHFTTLPLCTSSASLHTVFRISKAIFSESSTHPRENPNCQVESLNLSPGQPNALPRFLYSQSGVFPAPTGRAFRIEPVSCLKLLVPCWPILPGDTPGWGSRVHSGSTEMLEQQIRKTQPSQLRYSYRRSKSPLLERSRHLSLVPFLFLILFIPFNLFLRFFFL